jgi:hypothetical protein
MNFEADQDQMPIVSEVETNPQSERAEDEPSYLKLSRFDSQRSLFSHPVTNSSLLTAMSG